MSTVAAEQICPIFIILLLMISHGDILLKMTFVFLLDFFQARTHFLLISLSSLHSADSILTGTLDAERVTEV